MSHHTGRIAESMSYILLRWDVVILQHATDVIRVTLKSICGVRDMADL